MGVSVDMVRKMIIVTSRLPYTVKKVDGKIEYVHSSGGLSSGIDSIQKGEGSLWIGWPGIDSDQLTKKEKAEITIELHKHGCHPVFLNKKQVDGFYFGYSNSTLWPIFHYFANQARFRDEYWAVYKEVNTLFASEAAKFANEDAAIWVHDYQLMLVPENLRHKYKNANIGFFLHTPFPSFEIFRLLPERDELLKGLLGANLVGFHTYDYVRHFLSSVLRQIGCENMLGTIEYDDRLIQVDAFPIGIDYERFAKGSRTRSAKKALQNLNIFESETRMILSVDRADYSKGIPERLDAFELFLSSNPEFINKVHLILIAAPTRGEVDAYKDLRESIEQKVSRINGQFSTNEWSPITYRYQTDDQDELIELYSNADVMLVTPLRDGMNLVAKEYVASRNKGDGVLVLSETAGVATELTEAVQVNPNNTQQVADAILQALTMPQAEQKERMKMMQQRTSEYTVHKWATDFCEKLYEAVDKERERPKQLGDKQMKTLVRDYNKAKSRLILLDYDGTLSGFVKSPDPKLARPTARVKKMLKALSQDSKNKVIIVSGRPKNTLELFFKDVGLGLIAEHGGWVFDTGRWVKSSVTSRKWKKYVMPLLQQYAARTPGVRVEEKDFALVWHYRQVAPDLAYVRNEDLKRELRDVIDDGLGIFEGPKALEIKPKSMHKGAQVTEILTSKKWDFIMVIGDDYTDEDMFSVMPERAYTINVGRTPTTARFQLDGVPDVIELVGKLSQNSKPKRKVSLKRSR